MPAEAHAVQAYCTMFDFPAPGRPVTITTCPWRNRMPASWRAPSAATSGSAAPETAARRRLLLGLSIEGVGGHRMKVASQALSPLVEQNQPLYSLPAFDVRWRHSIAAWTQRGAGP